MAMTLVATAQSQLTLEYSRRVVSGGSLAESSQNICDLVSLSANGTAVSITCSGTLTDTMIAIDAAVDGQSANANWVNPQSGS